MVMQAIRKHSNLIRLSVLFLEAAILLAAGGALYPGVQAQDQGGGQQQQQQQQGGQPEKAGLDVDVDINSGHDAPVWYAQWWMWAIGLGVFLIVVIALTRGRATA
jgi:hypothetical protein